MVNGGDGCGEMHSGYVYEGDGGVGDEDDIKEIDVGIDVESKYT